MLAPDRPHRVSDAIAIDRRFRGPPESAQGGYTCGLVAETIDSECVAVSLRRPPPLERPLRLGDGALLDGDDVVAEGAPAELRLDVPDPAPLDEARAAGAGSP